MATRSADKRRSAVKKEESAEKEETSSKAEARSKLNKALENVEGDLEKEKEQQTESSEEESEKEEKVPLKKAKVKAEKEEKPVVKEHKIAKQAKPAPANASYIMKLFDRSVNLAKFTEETALYPLCRAWMQNAPRQMTVKTEKTPEPEPAQSTDEGDVLDMPKVRIRKAKPLVPRKDVKIDKTDFDKVIDSEVWTKEKLLEFHRGRWWEEKKKQVENSANFEEKHFAANLDLLDSLYKGNEE